MDKATVLNVGLGNTLMSHTTSGGADLAQRIAPSPTSELPYQEIQLKEGEVIFKEGDFAKGLYYVQEGCVKMMVNRAHARGRTTTNEYVTKLVGAGEFFGYKALIKKRVSSSKAIAVKPTKIWLYSKEAVERAISSSNPLVRMLLTQAVNDIENYETTSQLHYLASVQERIAYQLILLADKFGVVSEKGISLNLKLTRNEFAQLASTINESLSRHLTEFKSEGLIDINGKEIIIKDKDGLMKKSGNYT
ncbi:MAG: Crp/Fnr family transcriptional regulator [Bdellovibrionales bacterium]|nr:Crp/Fnr family transcriptional regulator [Bdellovibrionales bacterium]